MPQVAEETGEKMAPAEEEEVAGLRLEATGGTASKGIPRDPEGAFTRGIHEAPTCVPQVAE